MTLKQYLKRRGLSAWDFADDVGVSVHAVRKWMNRERSPRDKTKAKIAKVTKNAIKVQDWIVYKR